MRSVPRVLDWSTSVRLASGTVGYVFLVRSTAPLKGSSSGSLRAMTASCSAQTTTAQVAARKDQTYVVLTTQRPLCTFSCFTRQQIPRSLWRRCPSEVKDIDILCAHASSLRVWKHRSHIYLFSFHIHILTKKFMRHVETTQFQMPESITRNLYC